MRRTAPLLPAGDNAYLAVVTPPKGARFVSFQLAASDSAGNKVEQTIIRAYGLK